MHVIGTGHPAQATAIASLQSRMRPQPLFFGKLVSRVVHVCVSEEDSVSQQPEAFFLQ